ncbi:hypothetical protein CBS76997_5089 [Aspergillus niger]|nr:hypothetical protein CBS13152_5392 [Aspergillus niger]KAI3044255.1 hypothetical protein CBS76997_5089 [Aspergillus niger]
MPYTLPVAIINDTEDVLTVIEKTCWYYANGGAWTEDADHKLTLTLGGSGTSGMLRIRASSGHTFSVVVGYHNYEFWCDAQVDLHDDDTAVKLHPEYYNGGRLSSQANPSIDRKSSAERTVKRPKPTLLHPTDAVIRILHTTICGTDLHILAGDVATAKPGRILGHEGVGIIDSLGVAVRNFSVGQKVLISCITSCGTCHYCRQRRMPSQCADGGWILGNTIDGTQAEFVRVPHAAFSLHALPAAIDESVAVTLSDTVPTAYECGILNGEITPGSSVAIIGTGPIGLMCLQMSRRMFQPSVAVVIGRGMKRIEIARAMDADHAFSVLDAGGVQKVVEDAVAVSVGGRGFDVVIEAVGNAESFEMAQGLVGPGGTIASLGVFGCSCELRLEKLWHRNICLRTRLIDAVSTLDLLQMVEGGHIDPSFLVTHRFAFDDMENAYEAFEKSSKHGSLKVVVSMPGTEFASGVINGPSVNGSLQVSRL